MSRWIFRACILVLGLTMLSTFIYSLTTLPNRSMSDDMINYPAYKMVISVCLLGNLLVWGLYFHANTPLNQAAVDWGYMTLLTMAIGWVGLVTNLQGPVHLAFVGVFSAAHFIMLLTLCHLVHDLDMALLLRFSLVIALFCDMLMLSLYNGDWFYIPEHISFITYAVFFTVFFCVHTYDQWGVYCALQEGLEGVFVCRTLV